MDNEAKLAHPPTLPGVPGGVRTGCVPGGTAADVHNVRPPRHICSSHAKAERSPGFRLKPSQGEEPVIHRSRSAPIRHRLSFSNPTGSENPESNGAAAAGRTWEALEPSQRRRTSRPPAVTGTQCMLASPGGLRQSATLPLHNHRDIRRTTNSNNKTPFCPSSTRPGSSAVGLD